MAEYTLLNDYHANRLPDTVSDQQGALIEPAAVALHARRPRRRHGRLDRADYRRRPDRRTCRLACHAAGATKIFVSEPNAARADKMAGFGVTTAISDPSDGELPQKIRDPDRRRRRGRGDRMRGQSSMR